MGSDAEEALQRLHACFEVPAPERVHDPAALPSASSAYILAMRMGGDGPGVAWLISASTLLGVGSLSVWLHLLG